ncbi:hypothetical protein AN958_12523 [Leucoagaricus sp. SymC.cos]|nr:hypothetical protein AN958_12523 [Leucoagaricus sp. SymC.cos]
MSSKRGRKRNDNLPPNRARDVQRAFRARRAAHLQVSLPFCSAARKSPSGPTGKDKPKNYETNTTLVVSTTQPISFAPHSRESSVKDSPGSRTSSLSPDTINVSMSSTSSRQMQVIDISTPWKNDLLLNDDHQSDVPGPTTSPYEFTPMTAPLSLKHPYPTYTSNSLPSSSSGDSLSGEICIPNNPAYSHSPDRSLSHSYSGQSFTFRNTEIHEEPPRHYSYTPSSFQPFDHTSMHSQSPSPGVPMHSQSQRQLPQQHRGSPVSYTSVPHRRCVADSHGFSTSQGFLVQPHFSQIQTGHQPVIHPRHSELMRSQDDMVHLSPLLRSHPYGADSRLNHQPLP